MTHRRAKLGLLVAVTVPLVTVMALRGLGMCPWRRYPDVQTGPGVSAIGDALWAVRDAEVGMVVEDSPGTVYLVVGAYTPDEEIRRASSVLDRCACGHLGDLFGITEGAFVVRIKEGRIDTIERAPRWQEWNGAIEIMPNDRLTIEPIKRLTTDQGVRFGRLMRVRKE